MNNDPQNSALDYCEGLTGFPCYRITFNSNSNLFPLVICTNDEIFKTLHEYWTLLKKHNIHIRRYDVW